MPEVSLQKASQHMLRYLFQPSGTGIIYELTQVKLLSDAVAGPLKVKIGSIGAADVSAWAALQSDPAISVYPSPFGPTAPAVVGYAWLLTPGGANVLQLKAQAAGAAVIEIRFHHTIDR